MVSININQSFSGKNINSQNSNSEETSLLDNIFFTIFSNLEDKEAILNKISESKSSFNDINEVDFNHEISLNPSEIQNLNFDKILEKNKSNFLKNVKKANLFNENIISKNTYEVTFEIDIDNFYSNLKKILNNFKNSINNNHLKTNLSSPEELIDNKNNIEKLQLKNQNLDFSNIEKVVKTNPEVINKNLIIKSFNPENFQKKNENRNNEKENKNLTDIKKTEKVLNIKEISSSFFSNEETADKNSEDHRVKDRIENISNSSTLKVHQKNFKTNNSSQPNNSNLLENQLNMLEKNWGNKLAKIIEKAILTGKERISVSLEPKRLGKLSLNLSLNNNNANIVINTENAASALLLNGSEDKLSQIFESSGLKLTNFQANNNNNKGNNQNKKKNEALLDLKEKDKQKENVDINKKKTHNENSSTVNLIA